MSNFPQLCITSPLQSSHLVPNFTVPNAYLIKLEDVRFKRFTSLPVSSVKFRKEPIVERRTIIESVLRFASGKFSTSAGFGLHSSHAVAHGNVHSSYSHLELRGHVDHSTTHMLKLARYSRYQLGRSLNHSSAGLSSVEFATLSPCSTAPTSKRLLRSFKKAPYLVFVSGDRGLNSDQHQEVSYRTPNFARGSPSPIRRRQPPNEGAIVRPRELSSAGAKGKMVKGERKKTAEPVPGARLANSRKGGSAASAQAPGYSTAGPGKNGQGGPDAPVKSTVCNVQILGTGLDTEDTAPSVLLFFENHRFIFNAGEGLQRYCTEHKVRFTKIDHIFLTRVSSETAGGLPGLLLTLANMDGSVRLSGPSNLQMLTEAMRTFVPRAAFVHAASFGEEQPAGKSAAKTAASNGKGSAGGSAQADVRSVGSGGGREVRVFEEEGVVKVSAVLLQPDDWGTGTGAASATAEGHGVSEEIREMVDAEGGGSRPDEAAALFGSRGSGKRRRMDSPNKGEEVAEGTSTPQTETASVESKAQRTGVPQPADLAVVYICELPPVQGKFDPEKAKALGVQPGKKYGLLQRGISVAADEEDRMVHPSDVLSPPVPGPVLLLVDCPTAAHLPSLVSASGLHRLYPTLPQAAGKQVTLAVHLGPHAVVQGGQYRAWMARLGKQTQHVLAGHGRKERVAPILESSARLTARLNFICPHLFPAVGLGLTNEPFAREASDTGEAAEEMQEEAVAVQVEGEGELGPVTVAENLMKFHLRPLSFQGIDRSGVPAPVRLQQVQEELRREQPEVAEASREAAAWWAPSEAAETATAGDRRPGVEALPDPKAEAAELSTAGEGTAAKDGTVEEEAETCDWRESVEDGWLMEAGREATGGESGTAERRAGEPAVLQAREAGGRMESGVDGGVQKDESPDAEVGGPSAEAWGGAQGGQAAEGRGAEGSDRRLDVAACLKGLGRREMEMVFLGTGSSMPSKYRNVSAIYVDLFERGGVLLDCGEGTYGQLRRRYGREGADRVLARLGLIWISHIHADHHVGIIRILAVRLKLLGGRASCPPLLVVGPRPLKHFLDAYGRLEHLNYVFLECSQTTEEAEAMAGSITKASSSSLGSEDAPEEESSPDGGEKPEATRGGGGGLSPGSPQSGLVRVGGDPGPRARGKGAGRLQPFWVQPGGTLPAGLDVKGRQKLAQILASLGLARLTSVPVIHCPSAYGVVLEARGRQEREQGGAGLGEAGQSGQWKLVYSGDTRPCPALVEASRGATVLIHEATFDDGLEEDAIAKRHSMTREAIETGIAAGVYRTLLTHFSQRYPKIPVIDESYTDRTCIAFDMMSANLVDLPMLPKLLPAFSLLFKEEVMDAEEAEGGFKAPAVP